MIREPTVPGDDVGADDRSMRLVEYALAMVAIVAAAILALLR
ncbi:MAG TPA: hypothetical protein VFO73_10540 [Candidatus Limnocylindrales bacterium]|nr:hypothetical protein [Candidatus Limnocylindrales bacterium]